MKVQTRFLIPLALAAVVVAMPQDVHSAEKKDVYAWETDDQYASESPYPSGYIPADILDDDADDSASVTSKDKGNKETNRILMILSWVFDHIFGSLKHEDPSPPSAVVTETITAESANGAEAVTVTDTVTVDVAVESVPPAQLPAQAINISINQNVGLDQNQVSSVAPQYVPVTATETVVQTDVVTVSAVQDVVQVPSVYVSQVAYVQTRLTASANIIQAVGPTFTSTIAVNVQNFNNNQAVVPYVQPVNGVVVNNGFAAVPSAGVQPAVYTL
ncbi:hypothetical protein BX070DRAFT_227826 [Coemansia spiralis]|nr:hypothetical protein BX070DRAFT_227826 [Coemansia spiralis]